MKPEEFAKQFFDLWQQSAGQMMRDPAFSQKMLAMMQQTGQFWQAYDPTSPSSVRPSSDDGAGAKSLNELADRLELCEQRLAVMEALSRQWQQQKQPATSALRRSAASGSNSEK